MSRWPRHRIVAFFAGLAMLCAASAPLWAINNPGEIEGEEENLTPRSPIVLDPAPGGPATPRAKEPERPVNGNPLWAIPLKSLTLTRDRPLFVPSRRAPAPAVVNAPYAEPAPVETPPPEPEKPTLSLVGVVIGTNDRIAVFKNDASNDIVRLKTGEGHDGWILLSVKGREATLEKNRQKVVLALPPPGEQTPPEQSQ